MRKRVPEIAASEGYFSATVERALRRRRDPRDCESSIPARAAVVDDVEIDFEGDLAGAGEERERRRARLRTGFAMKPGAAFRSADWEGAKTTLEQSLTDLDYAAGTPRGDSRRKSTRRARRRR